MTRTHNPGFWENGWCPMAAPSFESNHSSWQNNAVLHRHVHAGLQHCKSIPLTLVSSHLDTISWTCISRSLRPWSDVVIDEESQKIGNTTLITWALECNAEPSLWCRDSLKWRAALLLLPVSLSGHGNLALFPVEMTSITPLVHVPPINQTHTGDLFFLWHCASRDTAVPQVDKHVLMLTTAAVLMHWLHIVEPSDYFLYDKAGNNNNV